MSNSGVAAGGSGSSFLPSSYLGPTGSLGETVPRDLVLASNNSNAPATQVLHLSAIALPSATKVSNISFLASSTSNAITPTNWWFALYDNNRNQLAITADQLTAAWTGGTSKTLAIATTASGAATSFTTTYTGLHYLGFMMKAGTLVNLFSLFNIQPAASIAPIPGGASDTAQTTPPAFPHTATAPGGTTRYYGWVS